MKERIVIEIPESMCKDCGACDMPTSKKIECYLKEERQVYEVEQVPETFEELKELCKGIKDVEVYDDTIYVTDQKVILVRLFDDGEIKDSGKEVIATNRTPQQMWQIIKGLIGE